MIRQVNTVLAGADFLSGYLFGYYEAYGADRAFLRFFGDENGGQLAIMDGVATVCWHEDTEELSLFLSVQSDVRIVRSHPVIAQKLSLSLGGTTLIRPVMKCETQYTCVEKTATPLPRNIYPLLASVFPEMPPFDEWYVDVCYRVRHGLCRISTVEEDGKTVASAMTVAEWEDGAVIGAVATDECYRRRGYAARCVTALVAELQLMGKDVYICPKNESAQRLYERLGFVICGETAILERT